MCECMYMEMTRVYPESSLELHVQMEKAICYCEIKEEFSNIV